MLRKSYIAIVLITLVGALLVACGGNGSSSRSVGGTGMVNLSISDPPTCSGTGGTYGHVYVTVKDVKIHTSTTANENDPNWIDLTPGMAPKQIDLLGQADTRCLLAGLGGKQITAGSYQQIRVYLVADSAAGSITGNQCGNAANCVVTSTGTTFPLQLSSEAQTGIKIPSGQLAGGAFTVSDGQTKDLVIDFDACASIVAQAGTFRLKPVLHAGEVQLAASITGKLVDSVSTQALSGKAIVALERKDGANVDRVVMQTKVDAAGNFVLCPVPAGTYDLVAVGISNSNVAYAATVITGVQPGATLGSIPMVAQTGANTSAASIAGQVTTAKSGGAASADIAVSALQQIPAGYPVTVPLAQQQSATATLTTAAGTCPAGTNCASYTLAVPAMWPNVGAFSTGTISFSQSTATPVTYTIDGQAFVPMSGGTQNCTPSIVTVTTLQPSGNIDVTPGANLTAAVMTFTGCQ